MKRILTIIYLVITLGLFADGSQAFSLDLKKDLILGGSGLALFGTGYLLKDYGTPELNRFNWFDEDLNFAHNGDMDRVGDIIGLAALGALPFLLESWDIDSALTIGVMFMETALISYGIKDILKAFIQRPRPYNFNGSLTPELSADKDRYYSFPSGHTTVAFMASAFSTYVFSKGESDIKLKWLMGVGTFSLAVTTAVLRVTSGVHYPLDVLAGAALGTGIGILVPFLHLNKSDDLLLSIRGDGLFISVKL